MQIVFWRRAADLDENMKTHVPIEIAPRNVGEILDDAWRLYRADMAPLLMVSGLVLVPCAALLLLWLTQPAGGSWVGWLWLAGLGVLLPFTGLTTGICQEIYHRWGEQQPATLSACYRAARSRWHNHVTCQLLLMLVPVAALLCLFSKFWPLGILLVLASLPVGIAGLAWQAVLTGGQKHLWKALRYSRRCSGRHGGKAALLVLTRLGLLLAALLNLHMFGVFLLWALEQLGGLSFGAVELVLTLDNPLYLLVLGCLAWWLLAPYNEAVNYLFYVDARTRYEGLDLWYRLEQLFPSKASSKAGLLLLLLSGLWLLPGESLWAQNRLQHVQQARQQVANIRQEMETTKPYPGGRFWQPRLWDIGERLAPADNPDQGRYRWYFQAINQLGKSDRAGDVQILEQIDRRLRDTAESLAQPPQRRQTPAAGEGASSADIHKLVPPLDAPVAEAVEPEPKQEQPRQRPHEDRGGNEPVVLGRKSNVGMVAPAALGGVAQMALMLLLVLIAVVVVAGLVLALVSWLRNRTPAGKHQEQGQLARRDEDFLDNPDQQNVQSLWQRADELARDQRFLEALRTLYLAVLAMLHQAHLIRYERTRTNGEYADQLRRHALLHPVFLRLTGMFELKWYGERFCADADYVQCRDLANRLQEQSRAPAE